MRRKKERSKQGQTNKQGKATQHTQGSEKTASGVTRTHDTLYSTCTCSSSPINMYMKVKEKQDYISLHVLVTDEKEGRKKEASKVKQTTQHTQARQSLFLRKMSCPAFQYLRTLPSASGGHDTLHSRQSALPLSYQGSSAGWAQISHLIVHLMNRLTTNYMNM